MNLSTDFPVLQYLFKIRRRPTYSGKNSVVIISSVLVDSCDAYLLAPYHNKQRDRVTPWVYIVNILRISGTLMTDPYRLNNTLSGLMLNGFTESIVTSLRFAYYQMQLFSLANKSKFICILMVRPGGPWKSCPTETVGLYLIVGKLYNNIYEKLKNWYNSDIFYSTNINHKEALNLICGICKMYTLIVWFEYIFLNDCKSNHMRSRM